MKEYKVVAVLWDDHMEFPRLPLLKDPEKVMRPTLTIGFIYRTTKKTITVVSDLEKYTDRNEAHYMVIYKDTIRSIKEYGTIALDVKGG